MTKQELLEKFSKARSLADALPDDEDVKNLKDSQIWRTYALASDVSGSCVLGEGVLARVTTTPRRLDEIYPWLSPVTQDDGEESGSEVEVELEVHATGTLFEIVLRRVREEVVDGDVSEETRMRQRAIAKEFGVCVSSCGHVSGHLGGSMDDDDDQEDPDTRLRAGRMLEMAFKHLSQLINDEGRPEELRWEVLESCVPAALSPSVHNGEWHRDHQNAALARGAVGEMMDLAADACDATVAKEDPGAPEMTPVSLIALHALRKLEPAVVFHIVGPLVAQQISSEDPAAVKAIHIEMAAAYLTRADDFDSNDQAACRDMQQVESRNLLAACVKEAEALAMDRAVLLTCIKDVVMRLGPRPSPINSPSDELDGGKELRQSLPGVVSECMRHLGKQRPVGDKALKTQHTAVDIMTEIVEKWPAALGRDGVTGQLIDYLLNVALSVARKQRPERAGSARAAAAFAADEEEGDNEAANATGDEDSSPSSGPKGGRRPKLLRMLDDIDFQDYDVAVWDIPRGVDRQVKRALRGSAAQAIAKWRKIDALGLLLVTVRGAGEEKKRAVSLLLRLNTKYMNVTKTTPKFKNNKLAELWEDYYNTKKE
ncbi:unnamed protein product [Vitrella brassicaformis CCMP3155]|uniref:Uncharacterized protein n=1 Tax=Vitrella brassicaformis (strain CCMP3155) TaxID=1169540 RepID=A0A0G4F476_VITBC|nr:unnamed protein product [Vitrella brassicaformis CCMP3155]|eukprot:CEM07048.1 unnamed protein product [Vitrella brassicaformis CCMP3155]